MQPLHRLPVQLDGGDFVLDESCEAAELRPKKYVVRKPGAEAKAFEQDLVDEAVFEPGVVGAWKGGLDDSALSC